MNLRLKDRKIKALREADALAERANSLWHALESFKLRLAKDLGISENELRENDIFVGDKS